MLHASDVSSVDAWLRLYTRNCLCSLSSACHLSLSHLSAYSTKLILKTSILFSCLPLSAASFWAYNSCKIALNVLSIIRMEDPGEEWEIEEYSSGEEVSQSKISWILSRGLWLGKKVVITGVVISSAPLVLPPLIVVSALGFAVSVPFGVLFASYACTEKLMSKLLPIPQSSGILDYGPLVMDKAEEEDDGNDEGEYAMEEEEKKQIQETKEKVEMRIELAEDDNKVQQKGNVIPVTDPNSLKESGKVVQEKLHHDEALKEKWYEEDDGKYLEGGDGGSLGGTNVKIEGRGEDFVEESLIKESEDEKPQPVVKRAVVVVEEEKKNANDVKKMREVVVIARPMLGETESAVSRSEEAVLKARTTGLLKKIRDEGNSGESVKKNKKKNKHRRKNSPGLGGKKEDESVTDTKEREKTSEIRHENLNEVAVGTDGPDARQADEITLEEENRIIEVTVELSETTKDPVLDDREIAQVAEMPVGSQSILVNGNHSEEKPNFAIVRNKQAIQESEMDNAAVSNGREDVQMESNAIHKESAGNGVPSKAEAAIASNEISPREKNLWEQINAMRLIVGYKAALQPSFTEELKALYVFTGVEPPSSFEDSANIRDAEDKLRFLMSIVGVK